MQVKHPFAHKNRLIGAPSSAARGQNVALRSRKHHSAAHTNPDGARIAPGARTIDTAFADIVALSSRQHHRARGTCPAAVVRVALSRRKHHTLGSIEAAPDGAVALPTG